MTAPKFKIGDKVKITHTDWPIEKEGKITYIFPENFSQFNRWVYLVEFEDFAVSFYATKKKMSKSKLVWAERFIELIENPIIINDYKVEFKKDGIQVGCQFVSKETVNKIHKKLNEGVDKA